MSKDAGLQPSNPTTDDRHTASGPRGEAIFNSVNSTINAGRDLNLFTVAGDLTVQKVESSILARLKTILDPVPGASYDSYEATRRSECFPNTRVQLLDDIEAWITSDSDQAPIYILDGVAGIGKSTVAQTIAIKAAHLGLLGASFFFSRDEDFRRVAKHVFPTIAFQLACYEDTFADRISRALDRHPDAPEKILHQQLSLLLMEPLHDLLSQRTRPTLIIMDALDECEEESAEALLALLGQYAPRMSGLKIFITTRPEWHLRRTLDEDQNHERFRLHEIEDSIVQSDIRLYLQARLSIEELRKVSRNRRNPWQPDINDMEALYGICGTLFIIAATAAKFILDPKRMNPQKQLSRLLDGVSTSSLSGAKINVLDETYIRIIFAAQSDLDESDDDWFRDLNNVLGALIALANPLPSQALASLLEIDPDDLEATLSQLHSLVAPSGDEDNMTFRIHHKSFPDFITDRERIQRALTGCKLMTRADLDSLLWIDVNGHHLQLAKACFRIMDRDLRWNMAKISKTDWYKDKDDITHVTPQLIPLDLAYAALHWSSHLLSSNRLAVDAELQEYLDAWTTRHILAWIEVMVIVNQVDGIYAILSGAIDSLNNLTNTLWPQRERVQELLLDAFRFVQHGNEVMRLSTMHIYRSCLPAVPTQTALHRVYGNRAMLKVLETRRTSAWDALITASVGHVSPITCIAFTLDGSRLASGSYDTDVRVWDTKTGAHICTLADHKGIVNSVAFSPDGTLLASASVAVHVWDVKSGTLLSTVSPSNWDVRAINSVAFSSDSSRLAFSTDSNVNVIRTSDIKRGENILYLIGHSGSVTSVAFSRDGAHLASGSNDTTVRIWDADLCVYVSTLRGHSDSVSSIAFLNDGCRLASGSHDQTIRLWDFKTGACISTFTGHTDSVNSIACPDDGTLIASASGDRTIRLWNVETGIQISTLTGHSPGRLNVAFSTDGLTLASGSSDGAVRLWNPSQITPCQSTGEVFPPIGHLDTVFSVAFSNDGSQLASGSIDHTICLWDARTGTQVLTFNGHLGAVHSVAFSKDGSRLASGSSDATVRLWGTKTGGHIHTLTGHSDGVMAVAFSSYGSIVASGSLDSTIRLWDANRGIHLSSLTGHSNQVLSVAFSDDGSRIVSGSYDTSIRIWDVATGSCQSTILTIVTGYPRFITEVGFSDDGSMLASLCLDKSFHIWNTSTGTHIPIPLNALSDSDSSKVLVQSVAFLPKDCLIAEQATSVKVLSGVDHSTPDPLRLLLLLQRETPIITGLVVATLGSDRWEVAPLCWFPPNVKAESFSVHSSTSKVAIGCSNGHVMLLDFSNPFASSFE